ncbi:DNA-3-methyladenine glycosylase [SCandidatus Aminicenantes bacterium Aminicenantia_JdfR_composite]|jgi:DNA-3-methyladenine glycosylase|nr:DNA-3-methyladenine glycosylase [SCandidatus Aminicenantes bacterium Aminicenantia_JdfR_composite]MCP2597000.1 DNA-3-methyladenine glycosylase [Candidatus Aminicenantes bacterium AC-335-G13]MCP2606042.1 DNA-3-methyladenine glycosylase [Candidatus Aminicenantes bacterium AC-708-I09]MCP2620608.1 DNA-3-methyladenine glycosylase [Candidatus Aminicenantes bacterium AC-334-E05]
MEVKKEKVILERSFFARNSLEVARDILGHILVRESSEGKTSGIIVETEVYRGEDDPASFAYRGRTKRSEPLYGSPGTAFVYMTYGMYYLLNIITEKENFPAAILIRAVEPLEGVELMKKRRKTNNIRNLASGPGKLAQAFAIDLSLNGVDMTSPYSPLYVGEKKVEAKELVWKPRIGIREGTDRLWRVYVKDNPFVSKK